MKYIISSAKIIQSSESKSITKQNSKHFHKYTVCSIYTVLVHHGFFLLPATFQTYCPNLPSLAGCRTWCPTDLQDLCCKALINKNKINTWVISSIIAAGRLVFRGNTTSTYFFNFVFSICSDRICERGLIALPIVCI